MSTSAPDSSNSASTTAGSSSSGLAANNQSDQAASAWSNQEATLARRDHRGAPRGRVRWDGNQIDAATAPVDRQQQHASGGAGARIQVQGGHSTVTVRQQAAADAPAAATGLSAPRPTAGAPLSPGSVRRASHPGPLNLEARLAGGEGGARDAAAAAAATADADAAAAAATAAKGLDEQGLDSRAFLELQRELQRHEASSEIEGGRSGGGAATAGGSTAGRLGAVQSALARQQRDVDRSRRRSATRFSDTPDVSSGASTPGGTSDSGSYDPANDSDLDHLDMIAGEVDGMPSKPKRSKTMTGADDERGGGGGKGWAKLRGLVRKNVTSAADDEEKQQAPPRSYEEGGPTNFKSVPVTTSSGTHPGGPRQRPSRFERQAAKMVRAHRLMQGGPDALDDASSDDASLAFAAGGAPGVRISGPSDSGSSTPDGGAALDARPLATGGVYGQLLKLYEQQQREQRRRELQRAAGGAISTGTSPMSSVTDLRGGHGGATPPHTSDEMSKFVSGGVGGGGAASSVSLDSARRRSRDAQFAAANRLSHVSRSVVGTTATASGFDDPFDDRPKAARSSAGVFGALVATTGNLVGAVSPNHAQLGPNPKRPGYTLDRYLLPEMDAKTLKRTAELVADAAPRPLAQRSRPGTPGTRSPTSAGAPGTFPREAGGSPAHTHVVTPDEKAASLHNRKSSHGFHLPRWNQVVHSSLHTPGALSHGGGGGADSADYFGLNPDIEEKLQKQEWQRKLRKRAKDKRRKEEVFITMHVAAVLQRQEFLLKLARALMMFGAPTHRIETQIQQTARVLEINARCIYFPNLMLISFGDDTTHTSETRFIKQGGGLDMTKLTDMHTIYWNVIHDKIGVDEASVQLDDLMRRKPFIPRWPMVLIGGLCSAFITVGPMGFNGSFVDALMAFPLGAFLVLCQMNITTELFSNVFEIMFATINSFVASALSSTGIFCYAGVVSGSIVLILPGFIVLSGSLELQSKNIIAGSVRLVYALIYSLFLGIGLSIGSSFWLLVSGNSDPTFQPTSCTNTQRPPTGEILAWYRGPVSLYWAFLTVPAYAIALSLRNQAKPTRKEFPVMVVFACAGWAANHFAGQAAALDGRQDITSALGSMAVGLLAQIYGRIFDGRSYVVSVTGILYQLPSGLSNGGLLNFASRTGGNASFNSGFTVAQSLVQVALGLTVGLFASSIVAYSLGGRKVRGSGMFSF